MILSSFFIVYHVRRIFVLFSVAYPIIITGTSCAGKSTIAKVLCDLRNNGYLYEVVRAVTTRPPRPDDFNFEYLDDMQFHELKYQKKLMTNDIYRGKYYGIKLEEYKRTLSKGKTPIIITSSSVSKYLLEHYKEKFMCFFIDVTNEELYSRLKDREKRVLNKDEIEKFNEINKLDRKNAYRAHYIIYNYKMASSVALIDLLWSCKTNAGILSNSVIKLNY